MRPGGVALALQRAGTSPLSARLAVALAASDDVVRALEAAPARARQPAVVLAALHDLALSGRAPELAAAYATGDGDAAARAAVDTLLQAPDDVVALAVRRRVRTVVTDVCAALLPAVAELARDAEAVGLVDVGSGAGSALLVDRVGVAYDGGPVRGDPASPVQLSVRRRGRTPVPDRALPEVVARVAVDPDPLDVTDPDDARWLRACVEPDRPERAARLAAELALAAADPPVLVRGRPVPLLPDAVARVPAGALPVVTTAWALSRWTPGERLRFLRRLDEVAQDRPVAWVSVEGVGVAPAVPTLGDRPASGHSIVGVALVEGSSRHVYAVARCWSRGSVLEWFAEPVAG